MAILPTVANRWPAHGRAITVVTFQQSTWGVGRVCRYTRRITIKNSFMPTPRPNQQAFSSILSSLYRVFDAVATWVTQLSWWKFLLFAALTVVAGQILQDELFSGGDEEITRTERAARRDEPTITIDDSGIHLNQRGRGKAGATINIDPDAIAAKAQATAKRAVAQAEQAERAEKAEKAEKAGQAEPAVPPTPPEPPAAPKTPTRTKTLRGANGEEVHIDLPPQIGEELSDAIEAAVDDAAEAKARTYHKQASTWFTSFVYLLVLTLFGTKALVGGKKRAEAEMQTATAAAERESMQRQLSEAKMQAMQAQVEPHFLFNTLAGVRAAMQSDPARGIVMIDHLIDYLRATIPQLRADRASKFVALGSQLDAVTAYLGVIQARMPRLDVRVICPEDLRSAAIPPLMLISLAENAVKHGIEPKKGPAAIIVTAAAREADGQRMLKVTVQDDGAGFAASAGNGIGLSNIRARLLHLYGNDAALLLQTVEQGGVAASIMLPLRALDGAC